MRWGGSSMKSICQTLNGPFGNFKWAVWVNFLHYVLDTWGRWGRHFLWLYLYLPTVLVHELGQIIWSKPQFVYFFIKATMIRFPVLFFLFWGPVVRCLWSVFQKPHLGEHLIGLWRRFGSWFLWEQCCGGMFWWQYRGVVSFGLQRVESGMPRKFSKRAAGKSRAFNEF